MENKNRIQPIDRLVLVFLVMVNVVALQSSYLNAEHSAWLYLTVPMLAVVGFEALSLNTKQRRQQKRKERTRPQIPTRRKQPSSVNMVTTGSTIGNRHSQKPVEVPSSMTIFNGRNATKHENEKGSTVAGKILQLKINREGVFMHNEVLVDLETIRKKSLEDDVALIELSLHTSLPHTEAGAVELTPHAVFVQAEESLRLDGYPVKPAIAAFPGIVKLLRSLSGGKPVGIRISGWNKTNLKKLCAIYMHNNQAPDFISLHFSRLTGEEASVLQAIAEAKQVLQNAKLDGDIALLATANMISASQATAMVRAGALTTYLSSQHSINSGYKFALKDTQPGELYLN